MFERIRVTDYLAQQNVGEGGGLPWFHSTKARDLFDIMNTRKLRAMRCNVFKDDLAYFFVGRPAYKYEVKGEPAQWLLPLVFVMRFQKPPKIKRIYPFDSGAFTKRRFPDYIQTFTRERFLLGNDPSVIDRLISFYFDDERAYIERSANSNKDIAKRHEIDARHDEIMALAKLYQEQITTEMDDRAAAIEVQVEEDVSLEGGDVLAVMLCEDRLNTQGLEEALRAITPRIRTYGLYPNGMAGYFGAIAQLTKDLYRELEREGQMEPSR